MIIVYLLGCLASLISLIMIRYFNFSKTNETFTLRDLLILLGYISLSWVTVLMLILIKFFFWFDELSEGLDSIVIWRRKK